MLYSFASSEIQSPAAEVTNEDLLARIQQHDESALAILDARHRGLFRAVVARTVPCDAEVSDVVQDCLIEIWRNASHYSPEKGAALGWMITLVRRRAIDRMRRRMVVVRAYDRYKEELDTLDEDYDSGADVAAASSDQAELVKGMIEKLPPPQQEVIHLAFYQGMSQRQIAAHTGTPLGTIKTRLELAIRKMKSSVLSLHGEMQQAA